jgi:serine/threonine-protein kinase
MPGGSPQVTESSHRRWQRLEALFDRAVEATPRDRERLLAELSNTDAGMCRELEALLAAANRDDGLLDRSAGELFGTLLEEAFDERVESDALAPPQGVGPWRVLREIGRGGMGVVYLAERAEGDFQQRVALKLLKRGLDTDEIVARFARERNILARLEHPAIARLIDGGFSDDGRPYLTMEFVEGVPITEYCAQQHIGLDDRLSLFRRVCEAVHFAHRKLVAHRDLKPSNILVTAEGDLKLLDFGVAKLLGDDEGADGDLLTREGSRPMTPAYAAPEQLRGEPASTASDVYSLGMILFELLAGRRPNRRSVSGPSASDADTNDPQRYDDRLLMPSAALHTGNDNPSGKAVRDGSTSAMRSRLSGDLDAIVATALRSEPDRRYPSAQALAEDLRRFLDDEPVWARPDSAAYRARKFVRRHRLAVSASALLCVVLAGAVLAVLSQSQGRVREAQKAEAVKEFVLDLFAAADPATARGVELTARELVDAGAERVSRELAQQPAVRAEMEMVLGELYRTLGLSDQALSLLDRSLASYDTVTRDAHPGRASALRAKGAALSDQGKLGEAEKLLRQAVEMHRRTLGPADAEVAEDLDWLGLVLRQQGEFDSSESALREALEIRQALFGDAHEEVATSLNNLAVLRRERGAYDEAEALYRRALEIRLSSLGRVHTDTADTLNNLAALLYFQGRWAEARERFLEVAEIYTQLYGESHPRTVMGQNNIGVVSLALGRNDEARPLFEAVLESWRSREGETHPNALMTRANLGLIEADEGDLREAEALFRELFSDAEKSLGERHPVTAVFATRLAGVLRQRGEYDEAAELYRQALEITRELRGDENPPFAQALHDLGGVQQDMNDLEASEQSLRQALDLRERLLGENHPDTVASQVALATVLGARGDTEAAGQMLSAGLASARRILPEDHPLIARAAFELGKSWQMLHGTAGSAERIEAVLPSYRRRYGERHWRTAEVELALAAVQATGGRERKAREGARRAHAVLATALGPEHRLTRQAAELAQ